MTANHVKRLGSQLEEVVFTKCISDSEKYSISRPLSVTDKRDGLLWPPASRASASSCWGIHVHAIQVSVPATTICQFAAGCERVNSAKCLGQRSTASSITTTVILALTSEFFLS